MPSSTQRRPSSSGLALLALGAWGCQEPLNLPSISYETQRARIGTTFDDPLCTADLAWFDQHVEDVERLAGVTRSEPVEVYIYGNDSSPPCPSTPFGCYYPEEDVAVAIWPSVGHEMVHAVTRDVRFPSRFWDEGTAEALSGNGTHRGPPHTLTVDTTRSNARPNYATAGHFVRFLYEDFGDEAAQQLTRGGSVEDIAGLSLDDLIALYEAEAPYSYAARNPCPDLVVPKLDETTWAQTYSFSCESEDASQFEGIGAGIVRVLELDESGDYEVLVEGGDGVRIVGCQMDDTDEPTPEFSNGDIMNQAELQQTAFGTFFDADTPHRLSMTAGRYRLALSSEHNDITEMRVHVHRL